MEEFVDQYPLESGGLGGFLRLVRLPPPPAFSGGGAFPTRGELTIRMGEQDEKN
jgi:hypothetical protein